MGKAQRTNVPWVTHSYDDESILITLRSSYPRATWKQIREEFNRCVPECRRRTLEAIYSKAKTICSAYNPDAQHFHPTHAASTSNLAGASYDKAARDVCSQLSSCISILIRVQE